MNNSEIPKSNPLKAIITGNKKNSKNVAIVKNQKKFDGVYFTDLKFPKDLEFQNKYAELR